MTSRSVSPEWINRSAAIIPGHSHLFGESISLDSILAIIRRYSLVEWLSFLSRLSGMTSYGHAFDPMRHREVAARTMGGRTLKAIKDYEHNHRGTPIFTCSNRQLGTLQQLALLNAPEDSDHSLESSPGRDELWYAITGVWDLTNPRGPGSSMAELLPYIVRELACGPPEDPIISATRAYYLYQLDRNTPTSEVLWLMQEFNRITCSSYKNFLLGGIAITVREGLRRPDEYANGWSPTQRPEDCSNSLERMCLEAFYSRRCGEVDLIRSEIRELDKDPEALAEHSLLALRKYPIIRLPDGLRFVTNHEALGLALQNGPRHELMNDCRRDGSRVQHVGGKLGEVFEPYVDSILESAFGSLLIRIRRKDQEKRADHVVYYQHHVVVFEVKGGRFPASSHYKLLSNTERKKELKPIVARAIEQLASTIRALWDGSEESDPFVGRDWTTTNIVPVVLTLEKLPLVWGMQYLFHDFERPIVELPKRGVVSPIRYLSVSDVETLPDLVQHVDFPRFLVTWGNDPDMKERTLEDYRCKVGASFERSYFKERILKVQDFVSRELKLPKGD